MRPICLGRPAFGEYLRRHLPDGRIIAVAPLLEDRARLGIGWPEDTAYLDQW